MEWRAIKAANVDWARNPISRQAGNYLVGACRDANHTFSTATLGEIADMGIKAWLRQPWVGPLVVKVLMWGIDAAADGACPMRGAGCMERCPGNPRREQTQ